MQWLVEGWSCQLVLLGRSMVLELVKDDQILSCLLEPGESPLQSAMDLISHPSCHLVQLSPR
jgi:hypothetical protein